MTDNKKRKMTVGMAVVSNLLLLGYFKYANMFVGYINTISRHFTGEKYITWNREIILPVGISFFIIQSLGYVIDVYRRDIYAEHNFFRYALFIAFFPQLVAGPIERSKHLLRQLAVPAKFSYENIRRGLVIMLYGFFLKLVIADRAAMIVDTVFNDPYRYSGFYIVFAVLIFAIQIYCDFYGYSVIAKGTALCMGIELMDNFNAPYYSRSIKEFWHRWHISLSTWFRDYMYIPLGGNRKGKIRMYVNLMAVMLVSGLWHGASLSFVVWGGIHGSYQVIESLLSQRKGMLTHRKKDRMGSIRIFLTFSLVCFAWIFFRANNIDTVKIILLQMCSLNNLELFRNQSLFESGGQNTILLAVAIVVLAFVDYQKYQGKNVVESFFSQKWWVRTVAEQALLFYIILFGCYGNTYDVQQFIYFQF